MSYYYTLLAVVCLGCSLHKNNLNNSIKVDLLTVNNDKVIPILKYVKEDFKTDHNFTNQIFVLRTEMMSDTLEVIASIYNEEYFGKCRKPTLFGLYGLFKFDGSNVIVFGRDSRVLFNKTGEQKMLNLLKFNRNTSVGSSSQIPYPPVIFEPIVWIFSGTSNNLSFKEKAQFNLIE